MTSIVVTKSAGNPTLAFNAMPENIVKVGATYWTCYRGNTGGVNDVRLASASAPEGPWTAYVGNPVLVAGGGWEAGGQLDTPFLVDEGAGVFSIFYGAANLGLTVGGIGRARSTAGITGPYVKDAGNPVLNHGGGAAWDGAFVRSPSLIQLADTSWLMFFNGSNLTAPATGGRIGYATALTLSGPWTKAGTNPVLPVGATGAWDDTLIDHPHVWQDVDDLFWMLYTGAAGSGGGTPVVGFPWGIGIATATDPDGPWTKHPDNPFLPPGGAGAWDEGGPFRGGVYIEGGDTTLIYAGLNGSGTVARGGTAALTVIPDATVPVGWDAYAAADPNGAILATVQRDDAPIKGATERSVRIELNGTGSGTFKINRYSSVALESVLASGNLIKCKFPWRDDYDFAFVLEKGDFKLADAKERSGEEFTFSGRGVLAYLDRAIMDAVAYTTGLDVTDKLVELWHATVPRPVGVAFLPADTGHVYAISATTRRIYKVDQTTHKIVGTSPVLWSGSDNYAAGLTADPSNSAILWALEAPATLGGSGNTKIRKIDITGAITAWNVSATFDLGSAIHLSDIRASTASLVTTNYSTGKIQKRSKTTGAVTSDYTVTYKGVAQTHPNGTAISDNGTGTEIAMWFGGSSAGGVKKALVANLSNPAVVTRTIDTSDIASFGGDWSLESAQTYFYMVSYTLGRLWKYQLTAATPHDPVDGKWRLDEEFPGAILWRIIQEATAVARPQQPLPDLDYDFTELLDSAGAAWASHDGTKEFDAAIGDSVLATALRLIPYGLIEQMTPYLKLIGRNAATYGVDRTATGYAAGKVRFVKGDNIIPELGRQDRERPLHSHMLATGKDNLYERAVEADLGYVREGFVGTDLADATALEGTAVATLADERVKAERLRFRVIAGDDEATGRYRPFTHYNVGDLVTLDTGSGQHDFDNETFILYAVTLEEDKAGKFAAPVIELGSATLVEAVSSSGGGSSGGGSSSGGTVVQTTSDVVLQGTDETGAVVTSASGRTIRSTAWQVFQRGTGVIEAVLTAAGRLLGLDDVNADGITDRQTLVRDAATATFIPGDLEDVHTAATDATKTLVPNGTGGSTFVDAESIGDAEGPLAIRYVFSSTTTDADPGGGFLRLSNASQYLAVTCRADLADVAGADVTALLDLIGSQTGTPKGYLRIQKSDDPTKWLVGTVSALASPAGYRNITIANIAKSANSPFADGDKVTLAFAPSTVAITSVIPATTVVSETTFGQAAVVGTDPDYAREDHSHGTPADPAALADSTYRIYAHAKFS